MSDEPEANPLDIISQDAAQQRNVTVRRSFIAEVYVAATVFISLTFIQLLLSLTIEGFKTFWFRQRFLQFFILLFLIIIFILFSNIQQMRIIAPYHLFFSMLIVELMTLALIISLITFKLKQIGIAFVGSVALTFLISCAAACLKVDLTKHLLVILIIATALFISSLFCVICAAFFINQTLLMIFIAQSLTAEILLFVFHTQTIIGGRSAQLVAKESLLGSIIIYVSFCCIFVLLLCQVETFTTELEPLLK